MGKTAIFFGSSTGNTERVANEIAEKISADVFDVADNPVDKFKDYDNIILGTSTLGIGDLQDDWEEFIPELETADLAGKVVALFGFGDGDSYADSFCSAVGTLYETIKDKGCKIVGFTSTEDYDYDSSDAEVDGKFVGLLLDEDNQPDLTDERVEKWVEAISKELK